MKRFVKAAIAACSLAVLVAGIGGSGRAEDKKPDESLALYLQQLQVKLDHAAQRANQPTAAGSNVVGLRGTKQESASKQLYWKGKRGKSPVSVDEVKAFRTALDQAGAGKNAEAVASLKTFQEKYPHSALLPDVIETQNRLGAPANP
jgi:TolA-binding protein